MRPLLEGNDPAHVCAVVLMQVVGEAARLARRRVTVLRHAGAAPCHPLDPAYPEGEYLTNLTLAVL